jgi:hypothetical protein
MAAQSAASLDRPCARAAAIFVVGTEDARGRGSNKRWCFRKKRGGRWSHLTATRIARALMVNSKPVVFDQFQIGDDRRICDAASLHQLQPVMVEN